MLGSKNNLTGSGNARLDVMQRLTSPGMIDWVDLDGSNHCASCRHFHQRHCMLFVQMMRSRLKNSRFLGPKLPHGQRACRRYEKAQGAGAHGHASKMGNDEMKVSERYPSAILKASDLEGGDLVVQVDNISLDVELGNSGKYVDLLRFTNDPLALSLGPTNARIIASLLGDDSDDWPGGWLSLFKDPTVKFGDTEVGGVRVRPRAPTEEEIAAAAPPTRQPGSKPATKPSDGKRPPSRTLDDEVPF